MQVFNLSVEIEKGRLDSTASAAEKNSNVKVVKADSAKEKKTAENGVTIEISEEAKQKYNEALNAIQMLENANQQGEAIQEAADDLGKIMLIFRRIANGDKVPPQDEKKLLEYSSELYQAAKNVAFLKDNEDPKKYKSVDDEEEDKKKIKELSSEIGVSDMPEGCGEIIQGAVSDETVSADA